MTTSEANKKERKTDIVRALVKKHNAESTTKELISLSMDAANMTERGARTYVYNMRQELGLPTPPRQKAAKKATPVKKKAAAAAAAEPKADTEPKAAAKKKSSTKKKTEMMPPVDQANVMAAAEAINE